MIILIALSDHSDPDERIVTFRKFLPFSAAFVASKFQVMILAYV